MKKYLKDLTDEEIKKVYKNNQKIQEKVLEKYIENEMYWIGEYLDCFKGDFADWSIGFYQYNHIKLKNYRYFIEDLGVFNKNYGLNVEDEKKYNEAIKRIEEFEKLEDSGVIDFVELDDKTEEIAFELLEMLLEYFNRLTADPDESYLIDFLIEELNAGMIFQDVYIKNKSYIAFENKIESYE